MKLTEHIDATWSESRRAFVYFVALALCALVVAVGNALLPRGY